jgi:HemY protein
MKFSILVVLAALLSVFAAQFLIEDPGYVVISFRGYLIEMSVPAMIFIAASVLAGIWIVGKMLMAPRRLGEAAGRYRAGRTGKKLTLGMIEVAEGNFARGEKLLARAAGASESPLFNYLQAARAAHLQGNDDRRD